MCLTKPSIGLHQRDNTRFWIRWSDYATRNTVVVVEHDEEAIMAAAMHMARAGLHGGEIIAQGALAKIISTKKSDRALSGRQ